MVMARFNSRAKGNAFERLVADMIAKALKVSVKEIFRTPLSGGHPYADRGDLTMSADVLKRFPFTVEAKHQKTFKLEHLVSPTTQMYGWMDQVTQAANHTKGRKRLLVIRGNRTPIVCAYPREVTPFPHVLVQHPVSGEIWCIVLFSDFLKRVKK